MYDPEELSPSADITTEARNFASLITGRQKGARADAAVLNAGLIHYVAEKTGTIADGVSAAKKALRSGEAFSALEGWVSAQNTDPEKGLETLHDLV